MKERARLEKKLAKLPAKREEAAKEGATFSLEDVECYEAITP